MASSKVAMVTGLSSFKSTASVVNAGSAAWDEAARIGMTPWFASAAKTPDFVRMSGSFAMIPK